ncbi:hypothetical protein Tco_0787583 [Tanacetum coccineum]
MGTDYPRLGDLGQIPIGYMRSGHVLFFRFIRQNCGILLFRELFLSVLFCEVFVLHQTVRTVIVVSPVRVLELDTHSSSEADPSESSLPLVSEASMVSPFLCSDDSESDTEMPERHVSSIPHDAMLARWRSRVASRSSISSSLF